MSLNLSLLLIFTLAMFQLGCDDPRRPEAAPRPSISDALKQAKKEFEQNPHLDPGVQIKERMHFVQGVSWQEQSKHIWAIYEFGEALKIQPTADGYNARAKSLLALERYREAIDDLNAAIEMNPDFALAYWGRARILEKQGKLDEALQDYDTAIRLAPENAEIHTSRGLYYCFSNEDYQKSVDDFTKAIELGPINWLHYANRALTHYKSGYYAEAVKDCTDAIERMTPETTATDRARVHFARHKSYENLGEVEESTADYERAKELDASVLR
jgi:tetratricopeptide (TPR) repeat protein